MIVIFTLLNTLLAFFDSRRILAGKKINHPLNAGIYIILVAVAVILSSNYWMIGTLLFNRLVVFNIALNLFRNLDWYYISKDPESIVDKLSKRILGNNGKVVYSIYFIIFLVFLSLQIWI